MASMPHLLRVPLHRAAGNQDTHVLVAVTGADHASHPLDLELLATDNLKAYVTTLSHSRVSKYRHSQSACSEPEWEAALKALLLSSHPIGDVQALARIADDQERPTGDDRSYMFIDVSHTAAGLTQPLGTLKLRKSNKAESSVELFDWCATAVGARDELAEQVAALRRDQEALQQLVAEETAKIRELARSKQEFEATHDSWLKDLLNEKKVKIRTQEQILATARVDSHKLAAAVASASASASTPRHGGDGSASRTGKGKRKAELLHPGIDGSSDEEAEQTDVDMDQAIGSPAENSTVADGDTTDSETTSEPESEPELVKSKAAQERSKTSLSLTQATSKKAGTANREQEIDVADESEDEALPHRKLPVKKQQSIVAADPVDDESTASE